MANYDNTNRGVLFKNDRKEKETHPDYKGSVNVDGVEMWLSAWLKTGGKGTFMSLSVQRKEAQAAPAQTQAATRQKIAPPTAGFDQIDDDIPF